MNFDKVKNLRLVFDNTVDANINDINKPILYNDKPIGFVSEVYEDRVECLIYYMECYPEFIKQENDEINLNAFNLCIK